MKTEDKFQLYTSAFFAALFGTLGAISLVGALANARVDLLFATLFCAIMAAAGWADARSESRKFKTKK